MEVDVLLIFFLQNGHLLRIPNVNFPVMTGYNLFHPNVPPPQKQGINKPFLRETND